MRLNLRLAAIFVPIALLAVFVILTLWGPLQLRESFGETCWHAGVPVLTCGQIFTPELLG